MIRWNTCVRCYRYEKVGREKGKKADVGEARARVVYKGVERNGQMMDYSLGRRGRGKAAIHNARRPRRLTNPPQAPTQQAGRRRFRGWVRYIAIRMCEYDVTGTPTTMQGATAPMQA